MTRKLTETEITNMLDFIKPLQDIPVDVADSIVEKSKDGFRAQLCDQMVYPQIIPQLKFELMRYYRQSQIHAGESVGVICAQSIGEKQTQTVLNSIDWQDKLLYTRSGTTVVQPIGQMIDDLLADALRSNPDMITRIPENRTEYLPLPDGYTVPSCDENGMCYWFKIEAVTRHLPVGKLVKVTTASGRTVTATQSKSFLVWNGKKFESTLGSDVKVGDILPTTHYLIRPEQIHTHLDLETIFPKDKYLYTSEIIKARPLRFGGKRSWLERNGQDFTLPYNRPDSCFGRRKDYFLSCEPGLIYIHTSNVFVSHVPDKILLDNDFGFFVGLYLSEGWCTKTFLGVSNNDPVIRKRITDYCDRYGITYHLVTSKGKNVRQGESNDLKVHSTLFARLFLSICGTGSANKRVPEFAYTAPDEFIKGLIDGYISGDGTVNKKCGSVCASSVSQDLIIGISFLLSYFGIFGRMASYQTKKDNVGSVTIKRTYTIRISNSYAQKFATQIHLTETRKQERLETITLAKKYRNSKGRSQNGFPERDIHFDKVVSVEMVEGSTEYV